MPQVPVAQNTVVVASVTDAKLRAADFGSSGERVGRAMQGFGEELDHAARQRDEYQDKAAHLEANRFELAHIEATNEIGQTVREAQGENAGPVANQAAADLQKRTDALLAGASPRARALLTPRFGERLAATVSSFREHAFTQTQAALQTTSQAIISNSVDAAVAEPDETRARELLAPVFHQNEVMSQQFGWSKDVVTAANKKAVSQFISDRATALGRDDPQRAIDYATEHRGEISDDAFDRIVGAYHGAAQGQWAKGFIDAHPGFMGAGVAPVTTAPADPLAPVQDGSPEKPQPKVSAARGWEFTAKWEGGLNKRDVNGQPSNFGVNQGPNNPGVDVTKLTKAGAQEIYNKRFIRSGADKLPPALAVVHADTFYIGETMANKCLAGCGGDPQKYMDLREQFMRRLVQKDPAKYGPVDKGWSNRNAALRQTVVQLGGGGASASGLALGATPPMANIADVTARIDALPGLSYTQREALKVEAKGRIAELHSARSETEDEAGRQAVAAVAHLGDDGFTSMNQLPASVLMNLNPSTFLSLQERAQRNTEKSQNKPASAELETLVSFTRLANPQLFASHQFQEELVRRGAPASMIRQVASEAGTVAGTIVNQKPDPISAGEIWTVAKPAFEASGIFLDHQEATGKQNKIEERQADAVRKNKAVGFLRDIATTWAIQNPGKKPDESLIKGWVGQALRQSPGGARLFDGDPHAVVSAFTPAMRESARQSLNRNGLPATEGNMYAWYKAMLAHNTSPQ